MITNSDVMDARFKKLSKQIAEKIEQLSETGAKAMVLKKGIVDILRAHQSLLLIMEALALDLRDLKAPKKYEHKIETLVDKDHKAKILNLLGALSAEGWELIGTLDQGAGLVLILKREIK